MREVIKKSEALFCLSLATLAILFFWVPTGAAYVLFDDSGTYIQFLQLKNVEGVMPLYPLFLFVNKIIWGQGLYLQMVVVEQTLIAVICIIYFVMKIKRRFALCYKEGYLIFLFSLIPFTTDYPMSMVTQGILTEGLSYALFYIVMALLLDSIWDRSFGKLAGALGVTVILALLRSQLQILFAVCGAAAAFIVCAGFGSNRKRFLPLKLLSGIILWTAIMGVGVVGVVKINGFSQKVMFGEGVVAEFITRNAVDMQPVTEEEKVPADGTADVAAQEPEVQSTGTVQEEEPTQEDRPALNTAPEVLEFLSAGYEESGVSVSQYSSTIFSKAMYEADYEDYLLFEDEEVQKQFLRAYEIVDEMKCRYPYAESGLRGWRHISDSAGKIGKSCFHGLNAYFAEYYNTTIVYFQYRCTAEAFSKIGMKVLMKHFGRFLWHTVRLMVPAFMFTVFFQKEQFYLLCHLITLFLYTTAIGLTIWCSLSKKSNRRCAEFMLAVLVNNVIMVTAVSLVFTGLQRYMVYAFGIFYTAYYLLLKEVYHCCLVEKGWMHLRRKKSGGNRNAF